MFMRLVCFRSLPLSSPSSQSYNRRPFTKNINAVRIQSYSIRGSGPLEEPKGPYGIVSLARLVRVQD